MVRQALLAKPTEKRPDAVIGLGGVTASLILLGPVLMCSQQNYLQLLLTVKYSKFSCGCCPTTLPKGKSCMKINE